MNDTKKFFEIIFPKIKKYFPKPKFVVVVILRSD